jgi:pimeloyl-ACP methyl ester carboxylesterase
MPSFSFDGATIHYREAGHGKLLVIIPGNTSSSALHLSEIEYFSRTHRVVALDLPGTGASERLPHWPPDWWTVGAHCVGALVDHLGDEPAAVVGTSGGAVIALLLAQLHPAQVRCVVADSCVERQPPEVLRELVAARSNPDEQLRAFWHCAHGDDWREVVDADSRVLLALAQAGGEWFARDLARVSCPVLFTGSLQDKMLYDGPAQMIRMARQIPNGRAYLANNGDHPFLWSAADEFRSVATRFLASVDPMMHPRCRAAPAP